MDIKDIPSKVVTYLETGLTKRKSKRNKDIQAFRKQVFKQCGYNYYSFLTKKHAVIYRDKGKIVSKIKSIFYKFMSYFTQGKP